MKKLLYSVLIVEDEQKLVDAFDEAAGKYSFLNIIGETGRASDAWKIIEEKNLILLSLTTT